MARSRNIKPGFFANEDLAEIGPLGQLLFAGLWTLADKEGRLEDRPKRIKAQIFPYYDCDVDSLLSALHESCFIQRYTKHGLSIIQVNNWKRHQSPHHKEVESDLPAPDKQKTPVKSEGNSSTAQAQSKHDASTAQEQPKQSGSCPTDSLNLIPDPLNPINNSLSTDEQIQSSESEETLPLQPLSTPPDRITVPHDFQPSEETKTQCWRAGCLPDTEDEISKFVAHHKSKGTVSADWEAEWYKWKLNGKAYRKGISNGTGSQRRKSGAEIIAEQCANAFDPD